MSANKFLGTGMAVVVQLCGVATFADAQDVAIGLLSKAKAAHAAKQYSEAADFYARSIEVNPTEPESHYGIACCFTQLGKIDDAISEMNRAIALGFDDVLDLNTGAEIQPLRSHPGFPGMVQSAQMCVDETVYVYTPPGPLQRRPLLVLLHGRGESPRSAAAQWREVADKLNFVIAAPKGPQRFGKRVAYSWDRARTNDPYDVDMGVARQRIDEAIKMGVRIASIHKKQVVVAGFSQGGLVALKALASDPAKHPRAIVVCPIYGPKEPKIWSNIAKMADLRVHILSGATDSNAEAAKQLYDEMLPAAISVNWVEVPGLGHAYPDDRIKKLTEAFTFVMQQ